MGQELPNLAHLHFLRFFKLSNKMVELWGKLENTYICYFYQYYALCPLAIRMRKTHVP